MNGWQRMVREFHAKYGQPIAEEPNEFIPMERRELRKKLMKEEPQETCDAIDACNIVEIADGIADSIYVALGTAIEYGIDLEPVFAEVHRSNMTKTPGVQRDDGKILKGPGFTPPDIAFEIERQRKS